MLRGTTLPALALLAIACGGSNSSSAVDDLDDRLVAAVCQTRVTCGLAADVPTCTAATTPLLSPLIVDLVHAGRIKYDAQLGNACVASLGSAACDSADPEVRYALDPSGVPVPPAGSDEACDAMFAGTLGSAVACEVSAECGDGQRLTWLADDRCQFKPGCTPPACQGECVFQGQCDDMCFHDEDCAPGMFCSPQSDSCQIPSCAGDGCYSVTGCLYPSECDNFIGGQGVCTTPGTPAATGQACTAVDGCADVGDYCNPTSLTCVALVAPGSACGSGVPCVPYAQCTGGACAACPEDDCGSGSG
jgi:hypothetical protein